MSHALTIWKEGMIPFIASAVSLVVTVVCVSEFVAIFSVSTGHLISSFCGPNQTDISGMDSSLGISVLIDGVSIVDFRGGISDGTGGVVTPFSFDANPVPMKLRSKLVTHSRASSKIETSIWLGSGIFSCF